MLSIKWSVHIISMISTVSSALSRFFSKNLKIKPLGARVLVELDKGRKEKVGSLYVPQTAAEQINEGTIVAVGPGAYIDGKLVPMTLQVGQKVLMPKFGGQTVKFGKEEYTIVDEESILAIFD